MNRPVVRTLNRLLALCHASELGFLVTASNVDNRAVKALLHSYASQRARFAEELAQAVHQMGGTPTRRPLWLGRFHRGWIGLKTALISEVEAVERVALAEAVRGEQAAERRYRQALEADLGPAEPLVRAQLEAIQEARRLLAQLCGQEDRRLVMRLFDREEELAQAQRVLAQRGFDTEQVRVMAAAELLEETPRPHPPHVPGDMAWTGAGLGMLAGAVVGGVAAFSASLATPGGLPGTWLVVIPLLGLLAGGFIGGLLAFLLGWGSLEQDRFLYEQSRRRGWALLLLEASPERATEAAQIMQGINAAARAR